MTHGRKLATTVALFAMAIALVVLTAAIHSYGPLFVAWLPLVAAAGVLARRDPGYVPPPPARPVASTAGDAASNDGSSPAPPSDRLAEA